MMIWRLCRSEFRAHEAQDSHCLLCNRVGGCGCGILPRSNTDWKSGSRRDVAHCNLVSAFDHGSFALGHAKRFFTVILYYVENFR